VPALITKNEQAAGTLAIVFIPLAFLSTAYVPIALMPQWLQVFNRLNPISYVIEALRSLITTGFDWPVIGQAVVAIVLLGTVLQAITFWAFRRLAD
jgi:ABC-2 type transport system permease protein